MPTVNGANLKQAIRDNVKAGAQLHTDAHFGYRGLAGEFQHHSVKHMAGEYSRHEGENVITTAGVESFFSLLKRGVVGTFHHVSAQHLPLYLAEFDHRHNCRKMTDGERTDVGLPEYDWIKSSDFETQIRTRLQERLAEYKIEGYPYTTSEALAAIAKENQPELEERQKRALSAKRSVNDALDSLDTIVRTAIVRAQSEKRTLVTLDDMKASIQSNFCQVWPFCK
jgi:hypothetical protein